MCTYFSKEVNNYYENSKIRTLESNNQVDRIEIKDSILENKLFGGEQKCPAILYHESSKRVLRISMDSVETTVNVPHFMLSFIRKTRK